MDSPTLSDWVAIVAQVCVALAMVVMGLLSHSRKKLTSKAVLWGLLFCVPYLWEGGPALFFGLFLFPLTFILLTHIGYGIRWILVRAGILATKGHDGSQTIDGAGQA